MKSVYIILTILLSGIPKFAYGLCREGTHETYQSSSFQLFSQYDVTCMSNENDCRIFDARRMSCAQCEGEMNLIYNHIKGNYCKEPWSIDSFCDVRMVLGIICIIALIISISKKETLKKEEDGRGYVKEAITFEPYTVSPAATCKEPCTKTMTENASLQY